jgi:hypothetical protein
MRNTKEDFAKMLSAQFKCMECINFCHKYMDPIYNRVLKLQNDQFRFTKKELHHQHEFAELTLHGGNRNRSKKKVVASTTAPSLGITQTEPGTAPLSSARNKSTNNMPASTSAASPSTQSVLMELTTPPTRNIMKLANTPMTKETLFLHLNENFTEKVLSKK